MLHLQFYMEGGGTTEKSERSTPYVILTQNVHMEVHLLTNKGIIYRALGGGGAN